MKKFWDRYWFWIVIMVGIILIIFLMVSTSFPDLFALNYVPLMTGGVKTYLWVAKHKQECQWLDATYPPLYYYTSGFYLTVVKQLGLISKNIINASDCPVFQLLTDKNFLFWVKFPYLVFHLLSALVFSRLFDKQRKKWFLIWFFNPLALFVSFIQGQFEIYTVFFLLWSLLFAKQKAYSRSGLMLGISGAIKNFPLLFLIPILLILFKDNKARVKFTFFAIIPYIILALSA